MNPKLPLEIFLPPSQWSQVHLLVTNDLNGLNDGIFFLRVHEWSLWFLSTVLAFTYYRPDVDLRYGEQTAMELLIQEVHITATRFISSLCSGLCFKFLKINA